MEMQNMEESELSFGKEEHLMDVLIKSLLVLDTSFLDNNFKEWVELEMHNMNVTMEVESEQVCVSEQENVAFRLDLESYATPRKTRKHQNHELWGSAML